MRLMAGDTTEVECLDVQGFATDNKIPLDGVTITLYKENDERELTELTNVSYHNHKFDYKFDCGAYYSIKIEKDGYLPRLIGIYTALPNGVNPYPIFIYEIQVEMVKADPSKQDEFYIDFPIALLAYDPATKKFGYSDKYTEHIKSLMMKSVELAKGEKK